MHDSDEARIGALMTRFLRLVSFKDGDQPRYGELPALFSLHARLIRTSGLSRRSRASMSSSERGGTPSLRANSRHSKKLSWLRRREHFGNVAHRFSSYAKRGTTNDGSIDVRGAISTQFIRTEAGWRISSMAWDDERDT